MQKINFIELTQLQSKIHFIRGEKVILDLANLYEIETRVLKQSFRRNEYFLKNLCLSALIVNGKRSSQIVITLQNL